VQFFSVIAIVAVLPVLIVGSVSVINATNGTTDIASKLMSQISNNVNLQFTQMYSDIDNILLEIASSDLLKRYFSRSDDLYETYRVHEWIAGNRQLSYAFERFKFIDGVFLVSAASGGDYRYLNSSAETVDYKNGNLAITSGFAECHGGALSTRISVSPFSSVAGGTLPYISFIRGVYENGEIVGFAIIDINAANLYRLWQSSGQESVAVWVVNSDGAFVYHEDNGLIGTASEFTDGGLPQKSSSGNLTRDINGEEWFIVYNVTSKNNVFVLTGMPLRLLNAPAGNIKHVVLLSCATAIVSALIIGLMLIKSILNPALKLHKRVSEFEPGNFVPIEDKFPDNEIGKLASAYNLMTSKINDMIEQVYNATLEKNRHTLDMHRAELQALQTQINPHFIYNTLSAINAHAILSENFEIQEIVDALGGLLRYSLKQMWKMTTLADEINQIRLYFKIQAYRYPSMPKIDIDIKGFEGFMTARLVLQPLAENIFTHAFPDGIKDGDKIEIRARGDGERLVISVADNGIGMGEESVSNVYDLEHKPEFGGIGLKNVHRRVQLTFGEGYGLKITANPGGGTIVKIILPLTGNKNGENYYA
jgi:two-component system sensor histidine kinase YesM